LKTLYDEMAKATAHLTNITPSVLQKSPRVIKILRYCLAPVISQMRLGQLIEVDSTESFEERGIPPADVPAARLANWFKEYLDHERFPWVAHKAMTAAERGIAEHYAKLCTVALVSNQNTATKYRNQRKEKQEGAIAKVLRDMGLTLQAKLGGMPSATPTARRGGIDGVDDVRPGHFVVGQKILGRSEKKQKTDLTVRPTDVERLFCIEAKAVGIRIDSTKRLKELNDKYTDWAKSGLPLLTVGVCAGFFNDLELIATIQKRGIPIFFEHDLGRLRAYLASGEYYDAPWSPESLFKDARPEEVEAAPEKIRRTPADTVG